MNHKRLAIVLAVTCVGMLVLLSPLTIGAQEHEPDLPDAADTALGTAFTYQGVLSDGGIPGDGTYNFRFYLWADEAKTTLVGTYPDISTVAVEVVHGSFTTPLDFGSGAFDGEARWLEIEVNGTLLTPLQPIRPTRYAIHAQTVPWSGLSAVPAGFADGADDDTTYTNGDGLSLVGTVFSVDFAGSGSASTAARSDHNHLGQTWIAQNNPLVISGTFGSQPFAPLVLNSNHRGLVVTSGSNALNVNSAEYHGLYIEEAGYDGVNIYHAGTNGVSVEETGWGVNVNHASVDGFRVVQAGAPSTYSNSSINNGVEVAGAQGNGVWIGQADNNGVHVHKVGNPSTFHWSDAQNGLAVNGAEGNGVYIGRADQYGVYVWSSGLTSIYANTTDSSGEWGLYTPDKISAGSLTAGSLSLVAQVSGAEPLSQGDLVAAVGLSEPLPWSGEHLPLVRLADQGRFNGLVGVVGGRMEYIPNSESHNEETVMELHSAAGAAQPGDYVAVTIYGVAQVRVDKSAGRIQPGIRLTPSETPGTARPLRTETLNGMLVAEGAPVIGIALEAPQVDSDHIQVLVTLR